MPDIDKLQEKVMDLQQDMGKLNVLAARFDAMIEKLTKVSEDISKLLLVQSTKLEYQERMGVSLSEQMEKRKAEVDRDISNLTLKIDKLHDKLDQYDNEINEKIDSYNESVKNRIGRVEKIVYMAIGGGASLYALFQLFFKHIFG